MSKSVAGAVAAGDDQAWAAKAGWSRRIAAPGRARLLWAVGVLLVGLGLFTLYYRQSWLGPFNSDGASNVLQAQSMLHGNLLLSGWRTSDVSFYTTELPEYMLVVAFRGLRPDVVHICGALTYTLAVLLAAFLARGRATGRAGVVRALLAAAIMIAPSIAGGTEVFLEDPDHAGTAVPILLLLLLLDRAPERWYVPAGVCALLAWVQVADRLTLIAATAPVAAVAIVRLVVLAARGRPRREFRYDALLLVAAGASVVLAALVEKAIRLLGGFQENGLTFGLLSPVSQIPANVRMTGRTLLLLFGANTPNSGHGASRQLLDIKRPHPPDRSGSCGGRVRGRRPVVLRHPDGPRHRRSSPPPPRPRWRRGSSAPCCPTSPTPTRSPSCCRLARCWPGGCCRRWRRRCAGCPAGRSLPLSPCGSPPGWRRSASRPPGPQR